MYRCCRNDTDDGIDYSDAKMNVSEFWNLFMQNNQINPSDPQQ